MLLLACSSWAASLDCADSETSAEKLACKFGISYEELADAFNLNCQAEEKGLVCKFETLRADSPIVPSTTNVRVPDEVKIKQCSTKGLCLQTDISTKFERTPSARDPVSAGDAENGDLTGEEANEANEFFITVGNHRYLQPFSRYAAPVARALRAGQHLWKASKKGNQYEFEMAYALVDIGIAHFSAVLGENESPDEYDDNQLASLNLKLAANAFQEAEKLYERVYETYSSDKTSESMRLLCLSMGNLYLQWGEIYQSSHYFEDDLDSDVATKDTNAVPSANDLSLRYFEKAELYYRLGLDASIANADEPTIRDTQIKLGHACHRLARCRIKLLDGNSIETIVQFAPGGTAVEALPQVLKLLSITGKAEDMFEEAERMYRLAIESEKDLDRRVQVKNFLATTLHDHGTAASYTGNNKKAVTLKQEGLAIGKEILPYLSGGSWEFMVQYLADGMLSVSTLLMQLGDYDETTLVYDATMEWYTKYNIEPSSPQYFLGFDASDEALEAQEQALVDFREMKAEYSIPDGYDEPMYTTNGAYEGYLHAMLGSLHLSRHEVLMAIDHFKQAVRLYEFDEAGQDLDLSIADTKVGYLDSTVVPSMYDTSTLLSHDWNFFSSLVPRRV